MRKKMNRRMNANCFNINSTNEEDLISHEDIVHLQETWNLVNKNRKEKITLTQFRFFMRLLNGKFLLDMSKHNFLFKCIVFEASKYHDENGINFQGILHVISYRYVDSKRFLDPDEFVEREDLEYSIIEEVARQTIQKWLSKCISSIKLRREIEAQNNNWIAPKSRFKSAKIRRVSNVHFERSNTLSSLNYRNFEIIITDESAVKSQDSEESFDEIENQTDSGEFLYASSIKHCIDEAHDLFNDEVDHYQFD